MMLRGLGTYPSAYTPSATDMCFNMNTYSPAPCSGPTDDLLCMNGGQQGKCSTLGSWATPVPILTLTEALKYCNNQVGCQVTNAAPCDPVFVAAGFQNCSQQGLVSFYTLGQANLTGPNQYNAPVTANTAGGLTYQDAQWLAQQGIIQPLSSPTATITPTFNPVNPDATAAPPSATGWGGSAGGSYSTTQTQIPLIPIEQMTPMPQQPTGISTPVPQQPSQPYIPPTQPTSGGTPIYASAPAPTGGTTPGSNPAQQQYAAPPPADASSTSIIPGLSNNTLYIAAGAVLLLLVLKK